MVTNRQRSPVGPHAPRDPRDRGATDCTIRERVATRLVPIDANPQSSGDGTNTRKGTVGLDFVRQKFYRELSRSCLHGSALCEGCDL